MTHRSIARNVYRLQESLLHRPTFAYLDELERSQWLSRGDLEALQLAKLRQLLIVAERHSPWHADRLRAAGIELDGDLQASDLLRLPTMNKQDASLNRDRIAWRDVPGGAFQYNTGGSTGEPLIFFYGRRRQASDAAARMRARRWWGVEPGDREVYLWGAPVELKKTDRVKTIRDRLLNQLVLNAFEMSVGNMDSYLSALETYRPRCIYGYASSVALLAAHAEGRRVRLRLPELKAVCTTGEPLYAHQRELIQRVFGVPAANEFGSRDVGFTAHEAPSGQLLLTSESILLEALDSNGNPVAPGHVGEAVMTGLCSDAQPFIRYRTGDMVQLSGDPCSAGRGLHVIREVFGRSTDFVVRADGAIMHALAVIYVLRATPGVAEFKCIQHTLEDFEVQVVAGAGWDANAAERIKANLRARLGDTVRIVVNVTDRIPPEASGKHRYVVSRVSLPAGLDAATA
jgi:phenylacetate-CoA ligase